MLPQSGRLLHFCKPPLNAAEADNSLLASKSGNAELRLFAAASLRLHFCPQSVVEQDCLPDVFQHFAAAQHRRLWKQRQTVLQ